MLVSLVCIGSVGCAELPIRPNLPVYVQHGQTLAQYQQDAAACRQFAAETIGTSDPRAVVRSAALAGLTAALVGAVLGAIVGGPLAGGIGAAVGAGAGGAFGGTRAKRAADLLQHRYDTAYGVCMDHAGHRVKDAVP